MALFGTLRAGYTVVNVNPLYTPRELEHQLVDSGAAVIVVVENFAHTLQEVGAGTAVKHVVVTSIGEMLGLKGVLVDFVLRHVKKVVAPWSLPGAIRMADALADGRRRALARVPIGHDDIAFLQYTGGTTGVAKGAVLLHRNIVANLLQSRAWVRPFLGTENRQVIITPLPLYHIFSLTANCLVFMTLGGENVLIANPRDIPGFVREMGRFRFTAITGVNTLFNALLNNPDFARLDFASFTFTLGGGMAVQEAVARRWKEVTGVTLSEAYGLTETSPAATINPLDLPAYNGSIGLPISSTDIVLRDDVGHDVPLGQPGEICIRGPQVMPGYWNRPEETAKAISADGFFASGDIGVMDERGYVRIVDRKKDMILVSGFNVYPNEIEAVVVGASGRARVRGDRRSGRQVRRGGQALRGEARSGAHRGGDAALLPRAADRLQDAARGRVPRRAAEVERRQDPAPRAARRSAARGGGDGVRCAMSEPFRILLPHGEPVLRVVPMPADVNQHGDIFGGWIMSQVDIAGGVLAARTARGRVATVAVNSFTFKEPVLVGDVVSFFGEVARIGRTSVTISM